MYHVEFETMGRSANSVMSSVEMGFPLRANTLITKCEGRPNMYYVKMDVFDNVEESRRIFMPTKEEVMRTAKEALSGRKYRT